MFQFFYPLFVSLFLWVYNNYVFCILPVVLATPVGYSFVLLVILYGLSALFSCPLVCSLVCNAPGLCQIVAEGRSKMVCMCCLCCNGCSDVLVE